VDLNFSETYAQSLLASGERILRNQRQHWFGLVFRWGLGIVLILVGLGLFIVGGWLPGDGILGSIRSIAGIITLVVLLAGIAQMLLAYFQWENDRDVITTRRIIQTSGFVNRKAADTSLEKINDALLEQGLIGRVFGYGSLDVMTASASGINKMRFLTTPNDFKKDMMEAKHALEMGVASGRFADAPLRAEPVVTTSPVGSREPVVDAAGQAAAAAAPATAQAAPGVAPAPPAESAADVTETLAKLADLRDKGVITAADYEAKKTELLGRI
jgi:membrane protein YdbS with pleckstrin-like domain